MLLSSIVSLAFALAAFDGALAAPAPQGTRISSMSVAMSGLAALKTASRQAQRANGVFAKGKYRSQEKMASPCVDGKANGTYSCENVDMAAFLSHEDMGSVTVRGTPAAAWPQC